MRRRVTAHALRAFLLGSTLLGGCHPSPPATRPAEARTKRDGTATPAAVARAWVDAVLAADWDALAALYPPSVQEVAGAEIAAASPDDKAELQGLARKVAAALAAGEPRFVEVPAVLAEPAQREWYYCGEKPPGPEWKSPCSVSVVTVGGRWYVRSVEPHPARRH